MKKFGFTLVEMLMALLIVSVILSASLPVITARQKAMTKEFSNYVAFPIGGIIAWGTDKALPDNTWLECNGQAIPNGIEYEEIRSIYGENLPDYRGVFLRGYGVTSEITNSWTVTFGNENRTITQKTYHKSGNIGAVQSDSIRHFSGMIPHMGYGCSEDYAGSTYNSNLQGFFHNGDGQRWGNYFTLQSSPHERDAVKMSNVYINASLQLPTDNEIRPVNKAVRWIIKVKN